MTNASPSNFLSGFPQAGTYRTEFRAAKGGMNYLVRLRSVASGSVASNEFNTEGIDSNDIENTLEYKVNGTVTPHDDVFAAVVNAAMTSGDPVVLNVARTSGGATIFSLSIEMICVAKS